METSRSHTWSGIKVKAGHSPPLGFSGGDLLGKPHPVVPNGSSAIIGHCQEAFSLLTSQSLKGEAGSNTNFLLQGRETISTLSGGIYPARTHSSNKGLSLGRRTCKASPKKWPFYRQSLGI